MIKFFSKSDRSERIREISHWLIKMIAEGDGRKKRKVRENDGLIVIVSKIEMSQSRRKLRRG